MVVGYLLSFSTFSSSADSWLTSKTRTPQQCYQNLSVTATLMHLKVLWPAHRSICIYTWTNLYIQISLDFGSIQCQPFSLLREKGNLGWINGQSETGKSNASGSIPYLLKRVLFSHNTAPHSLSTAHLIGCNKKSEIGNIFRADCAIR